MCGLQYCVNAVLMLGGGWMEGKLSQESNDTPSAETQYLEQGPPRRTKTPLLPQ
jgi:hypothetical protein